MTANRLGVLAFGDSITNGGGELQWGVALQSWALWLARGTGLPFTCHAVDGARVGDVNRLQIPAFERISANRDGRYDIGCAYIGVNDVRALDWDANAFEHDYRSVIAFLRARCDRVLVATAPLDLGRPRAGAKVRELNAIVARVGREHDALLLDLSNFRGRNLVMADHVHPTAFGQVAIAERALALLAADGVAVRAWPTQMIAYRTTRAGRLKRDLTYVYRRLKELRRALVFKAAQLRP